MNYSRPEHWRVELFDVTDGERQINIGENRVMNGCGSLIAALMKSEPGYTGLSFIGLGSGSSSWSKESPPEPDASDTRLVNEYFRKAILPSDITFVDSEGNPSDIPTNSIKIIVEFTAGEGTGTIREIGFFGGNATSSINSGILTNIRRIPEVVKTADRIYEARLYMIY